MRGDSNLAPCKLYTGLTPFYHTSSVTRLLPFALGSRKRKGAANVPAEPVRIVISELCMDSVSFFSSAPLYGAPVQGCTLLDNYHALHRRDVACLELIKVKSARNRFTIIRLPIPVRCCGFKLIDPRFPMSQFQAPHKSPRNIVNRNLNIGINCKLIGNPGFRINRIRVV